MENVVEHIQVFQQLKVLENKANVGDAKSPSFAIRELVDSGVSDLNLPCQGGGECLQLDAAKLFCQCRLAQSWLCFALC